MSMNFDETDMNGGILGSAFSVAADEMKRCIDASKRCKQSLVFCALSALKLLGVPIPYGHRLSDDLLYVCVPRQDMRSTVRGMQFRVWSLPVQAQLLENSISVVDPITACMQMLAFCSREEAVMMFDSLVCRDPIRRLASLNELEGYLADSASFRGRKNGMWAIERCREGTDSPMETRLRLKIVCSGLPCPEVNYRLVHPKTKEMWFFDLSYPEHRVALEYQGEQFHTTRDALHRDSRKIAAVQGLGWAIIPITWESLLSERQWKLLVEDIVEILGHRTNPIRLCRDFS